MPLTNLLSSTAASKITAEAQDAEKSLQGASNSNPSSTGPSRCLHN